MRHGAAAAAAAAAAALLAGCGGSGSGSLPEGAGKTPADAPAFVSLKTDPGSAQWKRALSLARRFPGLRAQLDRLDRYKDAVGPELDVVWLDFANNRDDVVALTKPRNLAQLKTLAQPDTASYSALSDGWVVVAAKRSLIDRFKRAAEGDKLDGDKTFKAGFGKLDQAAPVRAWVRGATVQSALDRALVGGGAAPRITHDAGDVQSIAASARAQADGATFDAYGLIDPPPSAATFAPTLQKAVPGGVALYVASRNLDRPLRLILRMVGESKPNFDEQLARVQSVLGIDLKRDVADQLSGAASLNIALTGAFGARADVRDPAAVKRTLRKLVATLPRLAISSRRGPVRLTRIKGGLYAFKGPGGRRAVFGVIGRTLVAASTQARARELAGARPESVPGVTGSLVLEADARRLVEELIRRFAPRTGIGTSAFTAPLGELTGSVTSDTGGLRGSLKLAIH